MATYHLHDDTTDKRVYLVEQAFTWLLFNFLHTPYKGSQKMPTILLYLENLKNMGANSNRDIHLLATDELLLAFRAALKLGFIDGLYFKNRKGMIGFDPLTGNPNPTYTNTFGEVLDSSSFNFDMGNYRYFSTHLSQEELT